MQIVQCNVGYYPYSIKLINRINEKDLTNDGTLILPVSDIPEKVSDKAIPFYIKPKKVVIPNTECFISNKRLQRKTNTIFELENGEEIDYIFSGVKSPEIILPKELKSIKNPGFNSCNIAKLEIPDSVDMCDNEIFDGSRIKHLILNEKLLSQISAKFLTLNQTMKLSIKTDKGSKEVSVTNLKEDEIDDFNFITDAVDIYLDSLHKEQLRQILTAYKLDLLELLYKQVKKSHQKILINDIVLKHKEIMGTINKEMGTVFNLPNIEADRFSITHKDENIKILSLKDVLIYRNLI